jgi:hypothetical protein
MLRQPRRSKIRHTPKPVLQRIETILTAESEQAEKDLQQEKLNADEIEKLLADMCTVISQPLIPLYFIIKHVPPSLKNLALLAAKGVIQQHSASQQLNILIFNLHKKFPLGKNPISINIAREILMHLSRLASTDFRFSIYGSNTYPLLIQALKRDEQGNYLKPDQMAMILKGMALFLHKNEWQHAVPNPTLAKKILKSLSLISIEELNNVWSPNISEILKEVKVPSFFNEVKLLPQNFFRRISEKQEPVSARSTPTWDAISVREEQFLATICPEEKDTVDMINGMLKSLGM